MADYHAPVDDLRFALASAGDFAGLADLPAFEAADPDLAWQILEEAGRFANECWAPLNAPGDRQGVTLDNGVVRTPDGFQDAYRAYVDSGFNGLPFETAYGGQGLPWTLAFALMEIWNGANTSLALSPLLTIGAVELLQAHGTEVQKDTYLPKLIAGQWTGTMNLSEPQAGTDVGAIKTRAEPTGDGRYRIHGQKVYITWGEHDLAENIVHMVLARLPDAPEGTKGLSLFLVPKFIPDREGQPGRRNDVRCVGLEEKLGIHASPTTTLSYGDGEGAVGWLIGEPHGGIQAMFTMMNNARLAVGVQGVALAERAFQDARQWAFDRVQSRDIHGSRDPVPIVRHPDVRRMLLDMRSRVAAGRALMLFAGNALDRSKQAPDSEARATAQTEVDILTPIVKAWCTDMAVHVTSQAIQVHGGMGVIEESGVPQHFRDIRVATIYEGTNGVQALDLAGRKVLKDGGQGMGTLTARLRSLIAEAEGDDDLAGARDAAERALAQLDKATGSLLALGQEDIAAGAAVATPYQTLAGTAVGGALLVHEAIAARRHLAEGSDEPQAVLQRKLVQARYFADKVLPETTAELARVQAGAASVLDPDETLL